MKNVFFSSSSIGIHMMPEQLSRQQNLSTIKISKPDTNTQTSTFEEKDLNGVASLFECSCLDFQQRNLPCVHMYKLAIKLKLFKVLRYKRSTKLIADFSSGYALDWKFAIPTCFKSSLDIKLTPRISTGYEWTQDHVYNFNEGAVFYNDKIAYESCWRDALKKLKYSIQIEKVSPTNSINIVEYEKQMLINKVKIVYGVLRFKLYEPLPDASNIKLVDIIECTQDKFVQFLKTGTIEKHDRSVLNLFE